ncbi:FecR family protein [Chitinophaga polysaccharea]|uniref:FecR family protein n=1 Tax=Chitinophaga polysaccharea TaxID=1293035 RepID=A0A561PPC1_9BACT|nr:FecR family protein [Chitinophaga polysaccharea]TWF39959.1 FecR family protein [Chitinophaga polysaccharea]
MDLPIHIIEKYLRGEANEEETRLVNDWFYSFDASAEPADEALAVLREEIGKKIQRRLNQSIDLTIRQQQQQQQQRRTRAWQFAAAVAILLGVGWYFGMQRSKQAPLIAKVAEKGNAVGNNKATLILANGKAIALDSTADGPIDSKNGMQIIKSEDGKVAYVPTQQPASSSAVVYNTIITPKSGQYSVTLSDGTKVWLNAASSLRYPVPFSGSLREVELTGEGYFEVATAMSAQGGNIPFIVSVRHTGLPNDMKVKVLGTKFNVMAYSDEGTIETSLVEGKVETAYSGNNALLSPGLQSTLEKTTLGFKVSRADLQRALAWKNGEFRFSRMDIKGIMRQVTRWYDVSVEYQGNVDHIYLSGVFSRQSDIRQMLDILEATGTVHFQLTGNKIIVSTK